MTVNKNFCVVIMAGGSGTRLWPLSRKKNPKQFQKLVTNNAMILDAYERVKNLVPEKQVYIATLEKYREQVLSAIPEFDETHLILEPNSKNSGPSMGYVAATLAKQNPDIIITNVPSDHVVDNVANYVKASLAAFKKVAAQPGTLLTLGIKPTSPNTGLGYIKMGKSVDTVDGQEIFLIDQFKEKPNLATAQTYIKDWHYLWNSAYYFYRAADMVKWLSKVRPAMMKGITQILKLQEKPGNEKEITKIWNTFDNEQIEFALVEDMKGVLTMPVDLGWDDVGTWNSLYDMMSAKTGKSVIVKGSKHFDLESKNTFVYSNEKLIVTIGVDNLVVVDSPDATLIVKKSEAGKIKDLLAELAKKETHQKYL